MTVLVINFNLNGISEAQYLAHAAAAAPRFPGVPGLIAKIWLADQASNTYGGLYLFEDRAAAEGYLASPIVAGLRANPAMSNLTAKLFDAIDDLTAVTQGVLPLASRAAVA